LVSFVVAVSRWFAYNDAETGKLLMQLLEGGQECFFESRALGGERLQDLAVEVQH
jgi:hypothetical protein